MLSVEPAAGFTDPVGQSQSCFRAVLNALARPGMPQTIAGLQSAPTALGPEQAAVLLTLADFETPVWFAPGLDTDEVRAFASFHTGAPIVRRTDDATFLFLGPDDPLPDLGTLNIGVDEYPDRSSTLVLRAASFGTGQTLAGPGIDGTVSFEADGLGEAFWVLVRDNAALYPLGVDFLLTAPGRVAGLPRTTRVGG